jgi:uncharacterized protein (TIGR03067 family)
MRPLQLGLVVLLAGSSAWGGDAKKDRDKLQGTWVVKSMTEGGKDVPPPAKDLKLTFAGDRWTQKGGGDSQEGTYKLDPTKTPKHIDMVVQQDGKDALLGLGIYALEGDTLRVGMPKGLFSPRPTSFDDKNAAVLTLKREKP